MSKVRKVGLGRRRFPKTLWQAKRQQAVTEQRSATPTPLVSSGGAYTVRKPNANDDEQQAARLRRLRRQRNGYPSQAIPELWESGTHIERDYQRAPAWWA